MFHKIKNLSSSTWCHSLNRTICYTSKCNKFNSTQRNTSWESIIGLEIHAQISSLSKLFSRAGSRFGVHVNNQVGFFDSALPGTLPVINKKCVEAGVLTGVALKCHINLVSKFDRKHYFYADLPAGFQITQQGMPIASNGSVTYMVKSGKKGNTFLPKTVRITQLQLEQDSGKSLHDAEDALSLIDLNRAGVALMEIVTEPDFRSGEEAAAFVKELQSILLTIGTCDGKMEEGSLRVDASVSLRQPGDPLGTRSEVKNINSIRHIAKAIEYEIKRQKEILNSGGEITNETRSFDYETGETLPMRDKEKLHDYRFLPEPNLPPLRLYTNDTLPKGIDSSQIVNVDKLTNQLPELPEQQRNRLIDQYKITMEQALIIHSESGLLKYFEAVMNTNPNLSVKMVVNILLNDLLALLNEDVLTYSECPIHPDQICELIDLLQQNVISYSTLKKVLSMIYNKESYSAKEVVEQNNLQQLTNIKEIEEICICVIAENQDAVIEYTKGKKKVFNYLLGQVQKQSKGRADPKITHQTLQRLLSREIKK